MNTLDDLRTVLATQAETVTDTAAAARTASVVERARAARRRRATNSLIGAVVVAVAAAGIAIPLTRAHRSAPVPAGDIRVDGIDVPKQVTLDQFGYAYASMTAAPESTATGIVKQRRLRVKVPANARNQAVLLVGTGLGHGTVALVDANGDTQNRIVGAGVEDEITGKESATPETRMAIPTYTSAWTYTVVARNVPADAKYGLVLYRRTDVLPAGVTDPADTSVFRYHVGGRTLVAAKWAKPGQTTVSLDVPGNLSHDVLVPYCRSSARHVGYVVQIPGDGTIGGSGCDPAVREDAGLDGAELSGVHGRWHHLVLKVGSSTDWKHVSPLAPEKVGAVGLAVYRLGPTTRVLGMKVEHTIEDDGWLWDLADLVPLGPAKIRRYEGNDGENAAIYALIVGSSPRAGKVVSMMRLSNQVPETDMESGGGGEFTAGPLLAGGTFRMSVRARHPVRSALVVYQPAHPQN